MSCLWSQWGSTQSAVTQCLASQYTRGKGVRQPSRDSTRRAKRTGPSLGAVVSSRQYHSGLDLGWTTNLTLCRFRRGRAEITILSQFGFRQRVSCGFRLCAPSPSLFKCARISSYYLSPACQLPHNSLHRLRTAPVLGSRVGPLLGSLLNPRRSNGGAKRSGTSQVKTNITRYGSASEGSKTSSWSGTERVHQGEPARLSLSGMRRLVTHDPYHDPPSIIPLE